MQLLYISHTQYRRVYGESKPSKPSRYLTQFLKSSLNHHLPIIHTPPSFTQSFWRDLCDGLNRKMDKDTIIEMKRPNEEPFMDVDPYEQPLEEWDYNIKNCFTVQQARGNGKSLTRNSYLSHDSKSFQTINHNTMFEKASNTLAFNNMSNFNSKDVFNKRSFSTGAISQCENRPTTMQNLTTGSISSLSNGLNMRNSCNISKEYQSISDGGLSQGRTKSLTLGDFFAKSTSSTDISMKMTNFMDEKKKISISKKKDSTTIVPCKIIKEEIQKPILVKVETKDIGVSSNISVLQSIKNSNACSVSNPSKTATEITPPTKIRKTLGIRRLPIRFPPK